MGWSGHQKKMRWSSIRTSIRVAPIPKQIHRLVENSTIFWSFQPAQRKGTLPALPVSQ